MRCKPPWTSTATTWFLVSPAGPSSLLTAGMSVPRNRAGGAFSGDPGPLAHRLPASSATDGHHRRNVVGAHGVKLGAAPDAPSWGQVLACPPPVPVRIQRRAMAATDTHPSPHCHACQARKVPGGAGCEAVRSSPAVACRDSPVPMLMPVSVPASAVAGQAANGGPRIAAGRDDAPSECGEARGWRIAQQLARPIGRSVTAGGSGRVCGRHPRPGKDPS